MFLAKSYRIVGYYLTLLLFGAFGLTLNAICLALAWLPSTSASERQMQRVVHWLFRLFIGWMALLRVCRVHYDPAFARLPPRLVLVANHPGLMDITYLLARFPRAICIFKPAIRRNPILGAAAVRAGYIINTDGVDAIRAAIEKVASGHPLLVFPEGTRTPDGQTLGTMRPGFAVIAQRAAVPVQLVHIACDSNVLTKRHTWWKPPKLPITVRITVGPEIATDMGTSPAAVVTATEQWLRAQAATRPPHPENSAPS